jgi:hypothetical protein
LSESLGLLKKDKYIPKNMYRFSIFIVLSAVAVVAPMFGGTVAAPAFAVSHENMTMSMDSSTGMMDNSTIQ